MRSATVAFALLLVSLPGLAAPAPPSADEARTFIDNAEKRLLELWINEQRASWVQSTYITDDTEIIAAREREKLLAAVSELSAEATRFDGVELPPDVARKLMLLKVSTALAPPRDPKKQAELTEISTWLESQYGKGEYCPKGATGEDCLDVDELSKILAESRDPAALLEAWRGWHAISPPMRARYARLVELANEGARDLGFKDLGALWRSGYDMPEDQFAAEVERLWGQVRPLYESLHCYVRAQLAKKYGAGLVPPGKPIPAHLLGNMWAQSWGYTYPLLALPGAEQSFDLDAILRQRQIDELEMVRYGERFFSSLGFPPLPETFWERSQFVKPRDRDVVCHASAWDVDFAQDLRLKMCIQINAEDFATIHHELGHNYYQRAYKDQPPLFRDSANDAFHEAIGDTLQLSVTPEYLQKIGLLDKVPPPEADLGLLMQMALDKVAFLPFGKLIDQWRWDVFAGKIPPAQYNQHWWELREKYQGVAAPVARSEADFDPGAKYHIPSNVPYTRYFLADILQFQFHRALCRQAGYRGPLHRCSIYADKAIGQRLANMLAMGRSRPWPDELEALTGERQMDATAIIDYFAPLKKWLDEQNKGQQCGW
ncbi:MAG: M2 family metallopeptidase [Acidobacteria bacterium]|nr:M2 family metallopeptidase [Acidobacteriota bacterium]